MHASKASFSGRQAKHSPNRDIKIQKKNSGNIYILPRTIFDAWLQKSTGKSEG
jgi:hypothetical protein